MDCTEQNDVELDDHDSDTCDSKEMDDIFTTKCHKIAEKQVGLAEGTYVLHINGTADASALNVAVGTSNNTCDIYHLDNNNLVKLDTLGVHPSAVVQLQFSSENSNVLYTGSADGVIRLWDCRLRGKLALQFTDTTAVDKPDQVKPILCFDVSPNNRLIVAGTELCGGEAFAIFWDKRNVKLLGGYWDTHTDDITQIKFKPGDNNTLISGSTDGLLNIYDLTQTSEEDALTYSLNTESSVEQLTWFYNCNKAEICCITHTVDVQLWKPDAAEPYAHFRRLDIGREIKRKSEGHCYIVGAHQFKKDGLFVLAGSNENNGECLRAIQTVGKTLQPMFILKENTQRVRSSWYGPHNNILITGGEMGVLNVWQIAI